MRTSSVAIAESHQNVSDDTWLARTSGEHAVIAEDALDAPYERLARLAARALRTPVALVTLLEGERERVAASIGIDAFLVSDLDLPCDFVIDECGIERVDCIVFGDPFSPSAAGRSLREHERRARSYLRVPLIGNQDEVVGSVCVVDYQARRWEDEDVSCLLDLADAAMTDAACRLRESEERYQRLIGVSHDAILVHAKGSILYANAAAAHMIGVEAPSELERRAILDLIHPDDREAVRKRIRYVLANQTSSEKTEFRFLRVDGTVVPAEVSGTCIPYRGTNAVLVVCRDATTKHALDALGMIQSDLPREIISESQDFVALAEPDGRIRYLNAAGRRMIGLGPNASLDRMCTDSLHPAWVREQLDTTAMPTALIVGSWSGDSALIDADGATVPVWQTLIAHRDTSGDLKMFSMVMRAA